MGALIRAHDWSSSPLGPPEHWPQALRTAVRLLLNTGHPMYIFWGPQGVCFYNDAYRQSIGPERHPSSLGRPAREVWEEIWGIIGPQIEQVMAGRGATWHENALVPITRHGHREDVYWTYSYGPIDDETAPNGVGGVLVVCTETTQAVRSAVMAARREARLRFLDALTRETQHLNDADALLATTTQLTGEHMGVAICAYADMDADEDGFTIRGDWAAPGSSSIVGHYSLRDFGKLAVSRLSAGEPLVINDNARELPPEEAATFQSIGIAATICMPLVKQGRLTALMAIHDKVPRVWTDDELSLIREVTERSWAHIERVGAEGDLRESERRYHALFNAIDEGFCIIEFFDGPHGPLSDYVHVEANPAYTLNAGIPNVVGRKVREMVPDEAQGWVDLYREVLVTGKPIRFEKELEATGRWLELAAFRVEPPSRKQVAVLFKDLTERKRAEEALRTSEENFRTLARVMPNQGWTARPDGMLDWFNEQVYAFSAAEPGSLDGEGWGRMVHPEDLTNAAARWAEALATGNAYETEFRLRRGDGAWRWHIARAVPIRNDAGQIARWIGTNTDIHDQKEVAATLEQRVEERTSQLMQTEEALRQSQKMEAVGQLTGGIAHDFNNLLGGISGSLELLEKRISEGRLEGVQRYISSAHEGARRAASLTQRLLAFSRRQALDPRPVDANKLIGGVEDLIRRSVGPSITVEVVGAGGLWPTKVDPSQLENSLLNLCINARDAMMPDGGRLTIETANKWLDERAARERDLPPGQYISICVTDTGAGMTPDVIARAFDPFFTTKPIGQGTGLGLSMVYGFVRQSNGQVRIYSEIGKGTTMCLYLPRHFGNIEEEQAPLDENAVDKGDGETVLVIDDEALLRMLVVDVLEENGYRPLEAVDGPSGLRILQSDARIDLLITDVGLPGGMNGRQVAEAARKTRPDLKVLFITGYAENALIGHGHLEPGMQVLTKPFPVATLGHRIRDLMER